MDQLGLLGGRFAGEGFSERALSAALDGDTVESLSLLRHRSPPRAAKYTGALDPASVP